MPRIIYPEVRTVTEEWVVGQAHDLLVNDALEAEALRVGAENVPDGYWPEIARPSYDEAYEILADSGVVTFASDDLDDARFCEMSAEDWREVEADHALDDDRLDDRD